MLCGTLAAATVISLGIAGTAQAAVAPTADLSFSPTTISAGTHPQMTFLSHNVPSGTLFYLEESSDGGQQWKTVNKTTDTQGTADLATISEGVYQFKIVITDNNTVIGASAPATLTVTGPGDAQPTVPASATTAPVPSAAPSGSGVPWLQAIVKPIWNAIVDWLVGIVLSWL
jgi:hypothetical protein